MHFLKDDSKKLDVNKIKIIFIKLLYKYLSKIPRHRNTDAHPGAYKFPHGIHHHGDNH